jgi:hypothetical protein
MKDPARTSNAVVVGEDTPYWSGTRRREHLEAGVAACDGCRAGLTLDPPSGRPAPIGTERLVLDPP